MLASTVLPERLRMAAIVAALLLTFAQAAPPSRAEVSLRLAMHDMMPMQGPQGGMAMDDMTMGGGQTQRQSSQSGPAGSAMPGMGASNFAVPPQAPFDHVEGRLAFLRAELRITDQQAAAWAEFAQALRSARQHILEARDVLGKAAGYASYSPSDRLEAYERHLAARLDAVHKARTAFERLYNVLDDGQRQTAAELVVPFVEAF